MKVMDHRSGAYARATCLRVMGLVAAVTLGAASGVSAQAGRAPVLEGNRLYEEGRFAEAHQKYLEAMAQAPGSPVIPFNDGNALYQDADYQAAMDAYQRAIETGDPALASAAWYNLGNALYRQQQLQESLDAYKQALRMNPRDPDAKHNLERVLEQMEQEQQQQQQEGDGDSEDEPEDQEGQPESSDQNQDDESGGQNEGDEQQDDQEQDDQQDEENEDQGQDDQENDQENPEEPPQGQGEALQPGEMTQEEAERLLDAITEDPGDVNRKPASSRGRKPKKPW